MSDRENKSEIAKRLGEEIGKVETLRRQLSLQIEDSRRQVHENNDLRDRVKELEALIPPPTRTWKFSYRIPPDSEQVQDGAKCLQDHGFFDLGHAIKNAIEVTE